MSSFEQACAEAKLLADGAVHASTKLLQASRELSRAAEEGDVAKIRRATDKIRGAAAAARQQLANAEGAWSLTAEQEEELLRDYFEDELIETGRREGLVLSRVSHCDLRGHQRAAVVGPTERCRFSVVVLDESDDALGEMIDRVELAPAQ